MAHRGKQATSEAAWATTQRRLGRLHGYEAQSAIYADQHYQRGYREGTERRAGVSFTKETHWLGNGFGYETTHRAWVAGVQVAEWRRDLIASNYAFEQRGAAVFTYDSWRKACVEGGRSLYEGVRTT